MGDICFRILCAVLSSHQKKCPACAWGIKLLELNRETFARGIIQSTVHASYLQAGCWIAEDASGPGGLPAPLGCTLPKRDTAGKDTRCGAFHISSAVSSSRRGVPPVRWWPSRRSEIQTQSAPASWLWKRRSPSSLLRSTSSLGMEPARSKSEIGNQLYRSGVWKPCRPPTFSHEARSRNAGLFEDVFNGKCDVSNPCLKG